MVRFIRLGSFLPTSLNPKDIPFVIKIMNDNSLFPNVSLFFFIKSNLNNDIKPESLSHDDFVRLNNILENQSVNSNNTFLFDKYNVIY